MHSLFVDNHEGRLALFCLGFHHQLSKTIEGGSVLYPVKSRQPDNMKVCMGKLLNMRRISP